MQSVSEASYFVESLVLWSRAMLPVATATSPLIFTVVVRPRGIKIKLTSTVTVDFVHK